MVRRVVLGGGVPLVGPQEELRGPSGYTPRGFTSSPKREAKWGFLGFITKNKQTNEPERSKIEKNIRDTILACRFFDFWDSGQTDSESFFLLTNWLMSMGCRLWDSMADPPGWVRSVYSVGLQCSCAALHLRASKCQQSILTMRWAP